MTNRINVEIYDVFKSASNRTSCRKSAMLYSTWNGLPGNGAAFKALIEVARVKLQAAKRRYWWNALSLARHLVKDAGTDSKSGDIRFYPSVQQTPTTTYLWRIYLDATDGSFELDCYEVGFNMRKLLDRLSPVNWRKVANHEKTQ